MKYLKEVVTLSIGAVGGFTICGIVVVKSVVKSGTLRTALVDALSNKIETLLYCGTNYNRPKVSYRSYYTGKPYRHQDGVKRRSGRYPWGSDKESDTIQLQDDIIFDTHKDAEETVDAMKDILKQYGLVTVADLYDFSGLTSTYKVNQYGWTDLSEVNIIPYVRREKYKDASQYFTIQFPQASRLK